MRLLLLDRPLPCLGWLAAASLAPDPLSQLQPLQHCRRPYGRVHSTSCRAAGGCRCRPGASARVPGAEGALATTCGEDARSLGALGEGTTLVQVGVFQMLLGPVD